MTLILRDTKAAAWNGGVTILREIPEWIIHNPRAEYCKYQPGQSVECKETWAWDEWYIFKATQLTEGYIPTGGWHSPVTMPRAAVRRHGVIESVDVVEKDGWWWEIKVKEATP